MLPQLPIYQVVKNHVADYRTKFGDPPVYQSYFMIEINRKRAPIQNISATKNIRKKRGDKLLYIIPILPVTASWIMVTEIIEVAMTVLPYVFELDLCSKQRHIQIGRAHV